MATIRVANQNQLEAALEDVQGGDTILLASGRYSSLTIEAGRNDSFQFSQKVTIASESAGNQAVIEEMVLKGASNIEIKDVILDYDGSAGDRPSQRRDMPFSVEDANRITIDGVTIDGHLQGGEGQDMGLKIKDSQNVTFSNSEIRNFRIGLNAQNSQDITIADNDLRGIGHDGMTFGGISGMLIEGNDFRDYNNSDPRTAHMDSIQFRTGGTEPTSENIIIRGNVMEHDDRRHAIYLGNELYKDGDMSALHRNILIENNDIRTGQVLGIAVLHAAGVTIRDNDVTRHPNGDATPLISVSVLSRHVTIEDNVVASVQERANNTWLVSDNVTDNGRFSHDDFIYNTTNLSWNGSGISDPRSDPEPNPEPEPNPDPQPNPDPGPGGEVISGVGRWDDGTLRINGVLVDEETRLLVQSLNFSEDVLILNGFGDNTFDEGSNDGNSLLVWRGGAAARLDSLTDFVELDANSSRVSATTQDDDLIVRIDFHRGVGELVFGGLGSEFRAAEADFL